ncbi:MAG: hypothetical protein DSZ33_00735 [Gammaproteobacteria bacterium]|nr:MAG: hypothetical protein DSZ33_00735 [Gammaproteobacteria bacterium]
MKSIKNFLPVLVLAGVSGLSVAACGQKPETHDAAAIKAAAHVNPCHFLDQSAVETLAGMKLQPGAIDKSLPNPRVAGCQWTKPTGAPAIQLQYWPKTKAPLTNWAFPDYDSKALTGHYGETLAVIAKANPQLGVKRGLASVIMRTGEGVIVLTAPYLQAPEGSAAFDQALKLADAAAAKAP